MSRHIAIVGAGVAGLASALALTKVGFNVSIREARSRSDLLGDGAGIQIGPNGTKALAALGVFDRVLPHAQVPGSIRVHDGRSGDLLTQLPLGDWIAARHGAPYWVVHRADLVRVLYDAVVEAGIDVRFSVTRDAAVDEGTIIGADGLWSSVRSLLFDAERPTFTGRVAWRTILPPGSFPQFSRRDVSVWLSPQAHLVIYPIRSDAALNVVLITPGKAIGEHWSGAPGADAMREHLSSKHALSHFHVALDELARADLDWRRWPLLTRHALPTYSKGSVGLVGDAAHPMLPFLAQGGVMALEDALALGRAFEGLGDDPARALAAYSAHRIARTQRVVAASERNGRLYHLSGAMALARNAGLAAVPGSIVMRGYDWLYGGASEVPTSPALVR